MLAQEPGRLQDVRKIYVDSFGSGEDADVTWSKVIAQIVKSGRFEVVQSQDRADAALMGSSPSDERGALRGKCYWRHRNRQFRDNLPCHRWCSSGWEGLKNPLGRRCLRGRILGEG
jgi:hypothetical protein